MANLDPRLFKLFETLVHFKMDWLVFELIEGIEAGIVDNNNEESAENLASARISARQKRDIPRSEERIAVSPESKHIEGDDQVVWAAGYVDTRLKEVLAMMQVSSARLNTLVDPNDNIREEAQQASVKVCLLESDKLISVDPKTLDATEKAVTDLHEGLMKWVDEVVKGKPAP